MAIDWDALDQIADDLQQLGKRFPALGTEYVSGEGDNPVAFIVGEAPGAQEAIRGRPFVGASGVAMRDLMATAGLYSAYDFAVPRSKIPNCWLTNVVKFRPPKNRAPLPAEIKAFRPYLTEEWIAVGAPKLIIPVGGVALGTITGRRMSILKMAGKCLAYRSTNFPGTDVYVWPMVHPAFALRNEQARPILQTDWELLGEWISDNTWLTER